MNLSGYSIIWILSSKTPHNMDAQPMDAIIFIEISLLSNVECPKRFSKSDLVSGSAPQERALGTCYMLSTWSDLIGRISNVKCNVPHHIGMLVGCKGWANQRASPWCCDWLVPILPTFLTGSQGVAKTTTKKTGCSKSNIKSQNRKARWRIGERESICKSNISSQKLDARLFSPRIVSWNFVSR